MGAYEVLNFNCPACKDKKSYVLSRGEKEINIVTMCDKCESFINIIWDINIPDSIIVTTKIKCEITKI